MGHDGYTLPEALTALLILGLAIAGLAQATHMLSRGQARLEARHLQTRGLVAARQALRALPAGLGPYTIPADRSGRSLQGDEQAMTFACGLADACALQLHRQGRETGIELLAGGRTRRYRIGRSEPVRFGYISAIDGRVFPAWPGRDGPDRLGAVELRSGALVLATLELSKAQDGACAFDVGLGACASPSRIADVRR
jgi:hypothetical protein